MTYRSFLVLAAAMYVFGRWGQRNAANLAPHGTPHSKEQPKAQQIRRGAIACQVGALLPIWVLILALVRQAG